MTSILSKIVELENLLESEVNEEILIENGESLLSELRESWKEDQNAFSPDAIARLQSIGDILEVVHNFRDLLEELEFIYTSDDAFDFADELWLLCEDLKRLPVEGRIRKEIRELNEKCAQLPSSKETKSSAELNNAFATLNSKAPSCLKCDSNMVLREGNGNYFWGCERFPECWGKRSLKKDELDIIPSN